MKTVIFWVVLLLLIVFVRIILEKSDILKLMDVQNSSIITDILFVLCAVFVLISRIPSIIQKLLEKF